jgi:hypothetical protein
VGHFSTGDKWVTFRPAWTHTSPRRRSRRAEQCVRPDVRVRTGVQLDGLALAADDVGLVAESAGLVIASSCVQSPSYGRRTARPAPGRSGAGAVAVGRDRVQRHKVPDASGRHLRPVGGHRVQPRGSSELVGGSASARPSSGASASSRNSEVVSSHLVGPILHRPGDGFTAPPLAVSENSAVTGQGASPGPECGASVRPVFSGPLPEPGVRLPPHPALQEPRWSSSRSGRRRGALRPTPVAAQFTRAGRSQPRQLRQPSKDARLDADRAAATKPSARRTRLWSNYTRAAGRAALRTAQYDAAGSAVCIQVR